MIAGPVQGAVPSGTCTLHASCVALGEAAILIRGAAGAGKSTLALQLLDAAPHAWLVADDRTRLARHGTSLVARPHPAIAGLIEVRGVGLVPVDSIEAGVVRVVVDLDETAPRLPAEPGCVVLLGVTVPRLVLPRAVRQAGLGPRLVKDSLAVALRSHSPSKAIHVALPG